MTGPACATSKVECCVEGIHEASHHAALQNCSASSILNTHLSMISCTQLSDLMAKVSEIPASQGPWTWCLSHYARLRMTCRAFPEHFPLCIGQIYDQAQAILKGACVGFDGYCSHSRTSCDRVDTYIDGLKVWPVDCLPHGRASNDGDCRGQAPARCL